MRGDGLIGAELHTAVLQSVAERRADSEGRPKLDLAVHKADLVRHFPVFADLDDASLHTLRRALVTRYAKPGEVILRKNGTARSVFFIASGAVEVETAGQISRLGRGEMFGCLSVLMKRARRAEVRAIAPSTLLAGPDAVHEVSEAKQKPAGRAGSERRETRDRSGAVRERKAVERWKRWLGKSGQGR
jgi:monovalent cation:H+ antiporter, CPA1 family